MFFTDQAKQQRIDVDGSAGTLVGGPGITGTGTALVDENGYSTFEMRQSRRGTMKSQRGTMRYVLLKPIVSCRLCQGGR